MLQRIRCQSPGQRGDHNASIEGVGAWEALSLWITERFAGVAPISTC
jgi:hypothetical protein